MNAAITFDTKSWTDAMKYYQGATHKTSKDVLNRSTKSLAIHAIKEQKEASASTIQNLEGKDWWPKYVAKVMSNRLGKSAGKKVFQKMYAGAHGGNANSPWIVAAIKMSKTIIGKRTRATRFLRFFFSALASKATEYYPGSVGGSSSIGKRFAGVTATMEGATDAKSEVTFGVSYGYKTRDDKTASQAEVLLKHAIDNALPVTVRDMTEYASNKMAEEARKISAR